MHTDTMWKRLKYLPWSEIQNLPGSSNPPTILELGQSDDSDPPSRWRVHSLSAPPVPDKKHYSRLDGSYVNLGLEAEPTATSDTPTAIVNVHRPVLDQPSADRCFGRTPKPPSSGSSILSKTCSGLACTPECLLRFILRLFPILAWLPSYDIKECLLSDVIAGFTIAILHIPQGMAYGLLASVAAINGLYVSFFPILIYSLMATTRHVSIGTFSIVSIMVASAGDTILPMATGNGTASSAVDLEATDVVQDLHGRMEIFIALAMLTGIIQVLMGSLRLGSLSVVLSDNLVSGFSTGAAIHVTASQIPDLLGVQFPKRQGRFKLLMFVSDLFPAVAKANVAAVLVGVISILVLVLVKELINPRVQPKIKLPLPIDLVVVIVATGVSYAGKFNENFNVSIMGTIPTGLPVPSVPPMHLAPQLLRHAFIIAIVSYAICLSMGKIFSKKHKYRISPNQELIAMGSANIFSSFFQCFPCSASLSRSLVQEKAGGKTQITGLVSCLFILIVLLFIGPFFYYLPKCILSCVILVALKGMYLQVMDFFTAWKISKLDAGLWFVTFMATILLDVDLGLLTGVIVSLLTVVWRSFRPPVAPLGHVPNSELYAELDHYNTREIPGVMVLRLGGAIHFANRDFIKRSIWKKATGDHDPRTKQYVVLDCSPVGYLDMAGMELLAEIVSEAEEENITVLLASCSVAMMNLLERSNFYRKASRNCLFPSVHDAVLHASTELPKVQQIKQL